MSLRLLLIAALAVASGCATTSSAPPQLLGGMSFEGRLWLLDAEEELAVAEARLEQGQLDFNRTETEVYEAEARLSKIGEDDEGSGVPALAAKEAKGQLFYAHAGRDHAALNVEVASDALVCARIRYELAKVNVAVKLKVPGSEEVEVEEFEQRAANCEKKLSKREDELRELLEKRAAAKVTWERRKAALAKKSRVARPGPYVE
jgi:hypothetical protein